jgi:hypothetical protein
LKTVEGLKVEVNQNQRKLLEKTRELKTVKELSLILIDIGLQPLSKTIVEVHLLHPSLSLATVTNCLNGLSVQLFCIETTERPGQIATRCHSVRKGIQCGMLEDESTSGSHKDTYSVSSTSDSHLDFRAQNFNKLKADLHPPQKSEPPNTWRYGLSGASRGKNHRFVRFGSRSQHYKF